MLIDVHLFENIFSPFISCKKKMFANSPFGCLHILASSDCLFQLPSVLSASQYRNLLCILVDFLETYHKKFLTV
eukprot:c43756_g1_i1 orf=1-219(-)